MNDEIHQGDSCASAGCPMLGTLGVSGNWYCVCHFRAQPSSSAAITAVLNQHRSLVDRVLLERRTGAGWAAIKEAEDPLIDLTGEIGKQYERKT